MRSPSIAAGSRTALEWLIVLAILALTIGAVVGGSMLEHALPAGVVWRWAAWLIAAIPFVAGLWLAANLRRLSRHDVR